LEVTRGGPDTLLKEVLKKKPTVSQLTKKNVEKTSSGKGGTERGVKPDSPEKGEKAKKKKRTKSPKMTPEAKFYKGGKKKGD